MQILLAPSDPRAAQRTRTVLEAAGHHVSSCTALVAARAPGGLPPDTQALAALAQNAVRRIDPWTRVIHRRIGVR